MKNTIKQKPTFPKLLGKGLMYSLMGAAGIGGLFLLGPTILPILTSVGLLGAPFGITFAALSSALYAIIGVAGLAANTKDTFIWGKDKIKSVKEKISILQQYIKEKEAENSNSKTTTAEIEIDNSPNSEKQTSQNTFSDNLKSYINEKMDAMRNQESSVAKNGIDRKRRTASMKSATSKLRKKEIKIQDRTANLEEKLQGQIQKKQEKLNKAAAKMRDQIANSGVNKKIKKEHEKLAKTTAARKEQESQDIKKAWGEVQQRLGKMRQERDQVKNAVAQAKQRLAAKKASMRKKSPVFTAPKKGPKPSDYGYFIRPDGTRI